jgi:hypothetical protein
MIGTGRTADDMVVELSHEELTLVAIFEFVEELVVRNISLWLEPMMLVKEFVESLEVILILYRLTGYPAGVCILNVMQHLLCDAFFGCAAVEGVVDAHPVDGEIVVLAELLVAKHFLREIAKLDVKDFLVEFLSEGHNHLPEELVLTVGTFCIDTVAQYTALDEHEGRQEGCAVSDYR